MILRLGGRHHHGGMGQFARCPRGRAVRGIMAGARGRCFGPHGKGVAMSGVRLLVGTRKGAFVLRADGKREKWDVSGPHFPGWEIYHVKGSPADQDRLYASQTSGWFGQVIQRSDNGGVTWEPVGNQVTYQGEPRTHPWHDGDP